jgi:hypothetical protein
LTDRWILKGKLLHSRCRNERDITGGEHLNVVIGDPQHRVLNVHNIAGDVDRQDLAPAITDNLASIRETRKEDAAVLYQVALAEDVRTGAQMLSATWQRPECCAIFDSKVDSLLQFAQSWRK